MNRWMTSLECFLRLVLPKGTVADSILGDLREEHARDLRETTPVRASLLYLRKAASIAFNFLARSGSRPSMRPRLRAKETMTMSSFLYDLKQALRIFTRRPGLTLAAVISLGLGIGANTAIFSLVNTILLKPLPYPDSQQLVEAFRIDEAVTGLNPSAERVSGLWAVPYEVHEDWLRMSRVLEEGGGYAGTRVVLQQGDESSSLLALRMTSGAFGALETGPLLGRTFLPEDDEVGASPVAVLSYGLWQSLFGGDRKVVGTQLRLNETLHTVVGVMPQGFGFPSSAYRLWISFSDEQKTSPIRNGGYLKVVARLSDGVTLDQARRDMERVSALIGEQHPEEAEHRVGLFSQKEMIVGDAGSGLLVLWGAVTLVLLIACSNIAGLFLVRASERSREIGVRRALGARGSRLVVQQISETVLLSLVGGALGWSIAVFGLDPVLSFMPGELPRLDEMAVDQGLLLIAVVFSVATGLITGLLPALRSVSTPLTSVLREGGRSSTGSRGRSRTQGALVVSQIALAFLLLSGAALSTRSMRSLLHVETGFDTKSLALANVSYPSGVDSPEEALTYYQDLERQIRSLPGVVDVGGAEQMPFSGGWSAPPVTLQTTEGERDGVLHMPSVTPSYFSAMGIPVLEGRGLGQDDDVGSLPVVVISQALADHMAPDGSPLGLRIRMNAGDSIWRTVVGVVGNVKYRLDQGNMPMAYIPLAQDPAFVGNWVIRTASSPRSLAEPFTDLRESMDPTGTSSFTILDDLVFGSTAAVAARFSVLLLGGLSAVAGLLTVFGVYGVLAYLVQMRSREIGIQLALGAERTKVLVSILARGFRLTGVGLGVGLLLVLGLGRIIESQLFGVRPWDPLTLALASLLVLGAALAASYVPARRAAHTDPVEALKGE